MQFIQKQDKLNKCFVNIIPASVLVMNKISFQFVEFSLELFRFVY